MKQMLELKFTDGTSTVAEITEINIKNGLLTISNKKPDAWGRHADAIQLQYIKELSVWTE